MGIVDPYFPEEICLKLAANANASVFIETGTLFGGTTKWAAGYFKKVHTIELSEHFYNKTKDELISRGNIIPHLGDSRSILPQILETENTNIVFWLDGHYSGCVGDYETGGAENPCPLSDELDSILSRNNDDIIIIDDARCMIGGKGYPSIGEIYEKIEKVSKAKRYLQICDDQIYIIPQKNEYMETLLDYVLKRSILLWNLYTKHKPKPKPNVKSKMRNLSINILKKTGLFNIVRRIYKKVKNIFCLFCGFISFLSKKKIIFMIEGGLGSQMWQYAIGQAIEKCSGVSVYYDLTAFNGQQMDLLGINKRDWQIDKVHSKVKVKKATDNEVFFYRTFFPANKLGEKFDGYDKNFLYSKRIRYLGGYYGNAKYLEVIENYIKEIYDFDLIRLYGKNAETFDVINGSKCSVAVHVRRGDYVGTIGDVVNEDYYMKAVDKMNMLNEGMPIDYFVFSNDIAYCKDIFRNRAENFHYIDNNGNDDGHFDMFLMSDCHNFIICSSSVGWWAAYLSKRNAKKIVIKSEPHTKVDAKENLGYKLCPGWLSINVL